MTTIMLDAAPKISLFFFHVFQLSVLSKAAYTARGRTFGVLAHQEEGTAVGCNMAQGAVPPC